LISSGLPFFWFNVGCENAGRRLIFQRLASIMAADASRTGRSQQDVIAAVLQL
jgi:hypothetical protein